MVDAQGRVLWVSGCSDENGVLAKRDGRPLASEFNEDFRDLPPHWQVITSEEQVQIYEERYLYKSKDGPGMLNTSFLGINEVVKDNRLLPRGYQYAYLLKRADEIPGDDEFESLLPISRLPAKQGALDPRDDPDFTTGTGSDTVTYRIPLDRVGGAVAVQARLNYQSMLPYYLRERFAWGEQTQRLYYLFGHANLPESKVPGWRITIQDAHAQVR